ncbi:MAG TPA: response regulator transcription factor [Candidatus Baltobacteraceae bacterium]|jgi:DNA-binding NarL/FixJ family response regulator|nr:response regulator transcription factor [Candidatus Baltobacteraceae bacterium]
MSVLPQLEAATVYVAGDNAILRNAVTRLLGLDPMLAVTELPDGSLSKSGVFVDAALLEDLQDVSIRDFVAMVKSLPVDPPERHLCPVPTDSDMLSLLSDREMQVVRLIAEGLSNKQISLRLGLSDKTVKNHISHILAKLNLSARTQVAIHAIRAGIV